MLDRVATFGEVPREVVILLSELRSHGHPWYVGPDDTRVAGNPPFDPCCGSKIWHLPSQTVVKQPLRGSKLSEALISNLPEDSQVRIVACHDRNLDVYLMRALRI